MKNTRKAPRDPVGVDKDSVELEVPRLRFACFIPEPKLLGQPDRHRPQQVPSTEFSVYTSILQRHLFLD